ncbi:hypothetical protein HT118_09200 [Escherichia coli]|nr:hypothetical protein [Escherichia coli]
MDARRGRILQGRSLAPDPVAARDKLRETRAAAILFARAWGVQGGGGDWPPPARSLRH